MPKGVWVSAYSRKVSAPKSSVIIIYGTEYTSFAFDESVFNNADVIILSDLRDWDGARFEDILMEIENCVGTNNVIYV
jgi:hypothetical protein